MRNGRRMQNGIKSPVGSVTLRPRASRHGRPMSDVFRLVPVISSKRSLRVNPATDKVEVFYEDTLGPERAMTPAEIAQMRFLVDRAHHSTSTYGKKNDADRRAGPKKVQSAPSITKKG